MNVEIMANNRTIRIGDCHATPEDCSGLAFELWQETAPEKDEELGGGTSISTERGEKTIGFVDMTIEQPVIK